jgi:hypothetical protein
MPSAFADFLWRVMQLCRKELLAVLKDPASRVILVVPAIMQSLIFGYAATYDLQRVTMRCSTRATAPRPGNWWPSWRAAVCSGAP